MNIDNLPIIEIGHNINFAGIILQDNQSNIQYLTYFPNIDREDVWSHGTPFMEQLHLDSVDWLKITQQMDTVQTEILAEDDDGKIIKTMFRKSQRMIDRKIQWQVFERDNYTCRYTGQSGIPLTVDHVDLWEHGGATIPQNLISCSHKANKIRGNMPYEEWINSKEYARISSNLSPKEKEANRRMINLLPELRKKRQVHKRKR